MGRQHQKMDRPGVRQVQEGSGEQGKMEKTGCKIICGAPTTLAVKELMMMMMMTAPFKFSWRKDKRVKKDGIVIFHLDPCCDLDLADSNPNFLHGSPAHANTPTLSLVIKASTVQKISSRQNSNRHKDTWTDIQCDANKYYNKHMGTWTDVQCSCNILLPVDWA